MSNSSAETSSNFILQIYSRYHDDQVFSKAIYIKNDWKPLAKWLII